MFYFDASKTKKGLKFFSDRHRFSLSTDNTVVHKYNIHNHIPREYGHQLGSNLNVSSVPVFHGSRTSPTCKCTSFAWKRDRHLAFY